MKDDQKLPIIFCGTRGLAVFCFKQLLSHPRFLVKALITVPLGSSSIVKLAKEHKVKVLLPERLEDSDFLSDIKSLKVSQVQVLGYGRMIPRSFLDLFPGQVLNFHGSVLPRWRGAAPIERAIMAGETRLGMSLQVMKLKLDTGDIIKSLSFPFTEEMSAKNAMTEMEKQIVQLIPKALCYSEGKVQPKKQDEALATYAHKIKKSESLIDWNRSAKHISLQIRALVIDRQAFAFYRKKRLKIYEARVSDFVPALEKKTPGSIFVSPSRLYVCCGDKKILEILVLQPENKRSMRAGDFINGYRPQSGENFGD